jgi:hypothetical protein
MSGFGARRTARRHAHECWIPLTLLRQFRNSGIQFGRHSVVGAKSGLISPRTSGRSESIGDSLMRRQIALRVLLFFSGTAVLSAFFAIPYLTLTP